VIVCPLRRLASAPPRRTNNVAKILDILYDMPSARSGLSYAACGAFAWAVSSESTQCQALTAAVLGPRDASPSISSPQPASLDDIAERYLALRHLC
jgi:hypothetical protein